MRYCNKTIKEWAIAAWRRNIGENLIDKVLRWLEWECRTINLFCVSVESNNTELHMVSLHYERLVQWWVTTGYIHVWWQYHNWSLTFALRKKYDVFDFLKSTVHEQDILLFVRRCLNCVSGPFVSRAGMKSSVHAERLQESRRRREFTVRMQDEAHRSWIKHGRRFCASFCSLYPVPAAVRHKQGDPPPHNIHRCIKPCTYHIWLFGSYMT